MNPSTYTMPNDRTSPNPSTSSTLEATAFEYSQQFHELIVDLHRGKETLPQYSGYIRAHLGGPDSRIVNYAARLCPEIEYHCGPLNNKRILDFGCGTGATTAALAHYCKDIHAFDVDAASLEICKLRIKEHGLDNRVQFCSPTDVDAIKRSVGPFDLILLNGVLEHIPLSQMNLRRHTVRALFELLKTPGHLYINDTPNRLYPYDFHTTQLWWIPWTKPRSKWAYTRAVARYRYTRYPTIIEGVAALESAGTWGALYWDIMNYLRGHQFLCLNTLPGHNRHIHYLSQPTRKRAAFEFLFYYTAVKVFRIPITALSPSLTNLVIKRI